MGESESHAQFAVADHLAAWRMRLVDGLTRAIALVGVPLSALVAYDANRLNAPDLAVAFALYAASATACALTSGRYRLRVWWTVFNFASVLWLVTARAGLHAGSGAAALVVALVAALMSSKKEGWLALGLVAGGQVAIIALVRAGVLPRPPLELADSGSASTALRATTVAGGLGIIVMVAVIYLLRELVRRLFEAERLMARQRAETAARRRAEEELVRAQKIELLARLAGGLVHDVNNNLAAAQAGAELIERNASADERSRRLARSIREACENAGALSRQLLALGRGGQAADLQEVEVPTVFRRLERLLQTIVGEEIGVEFSAEDDLPCVYANPQQLEQVLLNLALNARDAIQGEGKISLRAERNGSAPHYQLSTAAQPVPSAVRLHVSDTGHGIAADDLPRVFQPFFSTKDPERGTGLGLFVARTFVDAVGGRLCVRSRLGRGSTFTLELPPAGGIRAADAKRGGIRLPRFSRHQLPKGC